MFPNVLFLQEIFDTSSFSLLPVRERDSTIILEALDAPFYYILGKAAIIQHCWLPAAWCRYSLHTPVIQMTTIPMASPVP